MQFIKQQYGIFNTEYKAIMPNRLVAIVLPCAFILSILLLTNSCHATNSDIPFKTYSANSIYFYDPCEGGSQVVNTPTSNGIYKGAVFSGMDTTYLNKFALAASAEQGSLIGVQFELSILANLYDKNCASANGDCSYTAASLEHYLLLPVPPGWFATVTKEKYNSGGQAPQEYIDAAKDILVNGNRTIPHNIDEHDNALEENFRITYSPTGSTDKRDAANYVSGQTRVHNPSGTDWTFYSWCDGELSKTGTVTNQCDPFGYTGEVSDDNSTGTGTLQQSYSTVTSTGDNKLYNGNDVLSEATLQQIQDHRSTYEEAAKEYNFPWQILATLHLMEHSLKIDNPANFQGAYQLYSYTDGGKNENAFKPAGPISEAEFLRQSKIAASIVRSKAGEGTDLTNDDNVKRLFFEYNGNAKKYKEKAIAMGFTEEQANNGEGSPYVMNMADEKRDPGSPNVDPHWKGAYVGDHKYDENAYYDRPGAYVVFRALGGGTGSSSTTSNNTHCPRNNSTLSMGNGTIADTALALSWDAKTEPGHGKDDPKPTYVTAMKVTGLYDIAYCGWSSSAQAEVCAPPGASCDEFVATVMRYSKADENFNKMGAVASNEYMHSHPELYQQIDISNPENLQSGDIFATSNQSGEHGHIWVYVKIDGQHGKADASFNGSTGYHRVLEATPTSTDSSGRTQEAFRRINK